jgi:hypothetical protein
MIAVRPETLVGFAAQAATLKEFALSHYWNEPDSDMDLDVMFITRLLD